MTKKLSIKESVLALLIQEKEKKYGQVTAYLYMDSILENYNLIYDWKKRESN